jgi:hydrogenase maturation protease
VNPHGTGRRVVIGVGNDYRRDDGFGPQVIAGLADRQTHDRRLAGVDLRVCDGEPTRLIDLWTGADLTVIVDAVLDDEHHTGQRHELTLDALDGLADVSSANSHGISLGSTVALARALDRLPRRLVVLAVSGSEFGFGQGLTPPVGAAVPPVIARACELMGRNAD